ncbi:MAG TPA: hypothetical protein VF062_14955, partial [Candidatus Limnocylindrales bacterium]
FLRIAGNDLGRASLLYEWDVMLRDALRPELECAEVMLRNAYHSTLEKLRQGQPPWLCDPTLPVFEILLRRRDGIYADLLAGRISAGEAVNRLPFGFWQQLTASRLEKSLWVPFLHHAFAPRTDRARVHRAVEQTVRLRNRVHHYEPVFDQPLRSMYADMLWLFDLVCPPLGQVRRAMTHVPKLLDRLDDAE